MGSFPSSEFVEGYARPPAQSTVDRAIAAHTSVRTLLDDAKYATLLQGSYRNDTALSDLNDVDLVAVDRSTTSGAFSRESYSARVSWSDVFTRIEERLRSDPKYAGRFTRGDKCIHLNTEVKVDIVPAVRIQSAEQDPIAIYSFRSQAERLNWPRLHFQTGADKSGRTSGGFKKTVRIFKRWARCWFGTRRVAPSYYLECLVHAQPDHYLQGGLAESFVIVAAAACSMTQSGSNIPRVAGGGNILSSDEWTSAQFAEFQSTLRRSLDYARAACRSSGENEARNSWSAAFNGYRPQ